ncbi:MAG: HIT domain-containing protein [Candidatus Omnitrophota bacterium]|nr:HIT domain-containing protein [Candidatus Omnitrophota bacterium]
MTRKRLWAPWRAPYISSARTKSKGKGCLFCEKAKSRSDAKNLLISRGKYAYSLLNLYPYNSGHAMVVPYRHVGEVGELTREEWLDLWRLASDLLRRMKKVFSPQGFNLGINLGRASGAGIPSHLHLHVVPRWIGDANFMSTVGDTRVISQSLQSARNFLAAER